MATYYTRKDAASRLGVSVKTLDRRIKRGDFARTIVHGPHGPEIRVLLDDDGGAPDVPATPDTGTIVQGFAPSTLTVDRSDRELAVLALRALDEVRRENERLRAVVESLRRPWWRKVWEKVKRRNAV